jgi:hypothetical protein
VRRRLTGAVTIALGLPLVAISLWLTWQLARIFAGRVGYPADLEWMEGGQLYHAYRLLHGQPVYDGCGQGYLPFPYPPVHFALLAALGSVVGLDYAMARLTSIGALLVSTAVLGREVVRVAPSRPAAVALLAVTVGSIATGYGASGSWYDVVRVDSLYVSLLLVGAMLSLPPPGARRRPSRARIAAAAGCLVLSVLTKQTAVLFVPFVCLHALWRDRRSGAWLTGLTAVAGGAAAGALTVASRGAFWTLGVEVMSRHPLQVERLAGNVLHLFLFAPYLVLLPPLGLWLSRRRRLSLRSELWLGMLLCAIGASLVTGSKVGAFLNNLMTAVMLTPAVGAMLVGDWLARLPRRRLRRACLAIVCSLLAAGLLYLHPLEPRLYQPTPQRWRSALHLNALLRRLPGGVIMPANPFLPVRNGHTNGQIHEQGYVDVMGAAVPDIDVVECVSHLEGQWLVLNTPTEPHLGGLLGSYFVPHSKLPAHAATDVGMYTRPTDLWERRSDAVYRGPRLRRRSLFDFEDGTYRGWGIDGDAFLLGPTVAFNGYQQPIAGQHGRFLVSSFDPARYDEATGVLRSPELTIDRTHLGFRAGGGHALSLAVVLEVADKPVRLVTGPGLDLELLLPYVWDVSPWRGERARIAIIDGARGGWGHIIADYFELFDVPEG